MLIFFFFFSRPYYFSSLIFTNFVIYVCMCSVIVEALHEHKSPLPKTVRINRDIGFFFQDDGIWERTARGGGEREGYFLRHHDSQLNTTILGNWDLILPQDDGTWEKKSMWLVGEAPPSIGTSSPGSHHLGEESDLDYYFKFFFERGISLKHHDSQFFCYQCVSDIIWCQQINFTWGHDLSTDKDDVSMGKQNQSPSIHSEKWRFWKLDRKLWIIFGRGLLWVWARPHSHDSQLFCEFI